MPALLRLARAIDRLTARIGRATGWLLLAMVVVGALAALLRYLARGLGRGLPPDAFGETRGYLFSAVVLLGAARALAEAARVRLGVLDARRSEKGRAWIDLLGTV